MSRFVIQVNSDDARMDWDRVLILVKLYLDRIGFGPLEAEMVEKVEESPVGDGKVPAMLCAYCGAGAVDAVSCADEAGAEMAPQPVCADCKAQREF